MTLAGFPQSGISRSPPACGSPKLFAACRALLRLSMPRHPPCALVRLAGYARFAPLETRIIPAHLFPKEHAYGARVLSRTLLSQSLLPWFSMANTDQREC